MSDPDHPVQRRLSGHGNPSDAIGDVAAQVKHPFVFDGTRRERISLPMGILKGQPDISIQIQRQDIPFRLAGGLHEPGQAPEDLAKERFWHDWVRFRPGFGSIHKRHPIGVMAEFCRGFAEIKILFKTVAYFMASGFWP
jgi:hypothetical protein